MAGIAGDTTGVRNKYIAQLLQEGMDTTPIKSPWQGGSRLAHALLAGLEIRDDDKNSREALPAILAALGGGGGPAGSPMPSGPMPPQAQAAPVSANADAVTQANTPQDYINRAWGGLTPQGRDISTRTVLGEAANQGPTGMAGVADVMRNRAVSGGYGGNTMDQVALAKNQFEPWNTQAGRQKMQSYNPMSPAYAGAQNAVDTASIGSRPDVTGGAAYFYAPKAQAALAPVDGRPVTPPFAQGRQPSAVIGDHTFFPPQQKLAQAPQGTPQAPPPPPQQQPQQPQRAPLADAQMQQLQEMAKSPNPYVRNYAAQLIQSSLADRFKKPEYEIKTEQGVTVAVNKSNPQDRHVINDPNVAAALAANEGAKTYATTTATKRAEKDVAEPDRRKAELTQGNIVTQDIDRSLKTMDKATLPTTGLTGKGLSYVPGTASHNVSQLVDTIKANAGFQQLSEMRRASPTGAAVGNVTEKELYMLQAAIGNLSQSQDDGQLRDNLKRVKNIYMDIIHGPGNGPREKLDFESKGGASGKTSSGVGWSVR